MDELVTLARADGPYGEVVLRGAASAATAAGSPCPSEFVDELIVNGAFAMDSAETGSERALGRIPFPFSGARVLLGGLGLGYTANELLDADLAILDVVEIEPALVAWARQHVTVGLGRVADDLRVRLTVADIAAVLGRADSADWDAIVLDVDNGPDFLIHEQNAGLYSSRGLRFGVRAADARAGCWPSGAKDRAPHCWPRSASSGRAQVSIGIRCGGESASGRTRSTPCGGPAVVGRQE